MCNVYNIPSFRLATKMGNKGLLVASSSLVKPPLLELETAFATSTTTTITTTILSITPATSLESTLEGIKDGHRPFQSNCKTPPTQMSKSRRGQPESLLRVQKHQNQIAPLAKEPFNSSAHHFESNQQPIISQKSDSEKLVPSSNQSTISTTTSKILTGSKKDLKEVVGTSRQAINERETPFVNHVSPVFSPMLVTCPLLSPCVKPTLPTTLTPAPNPATRICSSSSKVSDV